MVDKNKDFLNNKYLGIKISGPEVLKKISTKNLRKSIVVISFDDIVVIFLPSVLDKKITPCGRCTDTNFGFHGLNIIWALFDLNDIFFGK